MSFFLDLIDRLGGFAPSDTEDGLGVGDEERLAVAALLVHVARADGRFDEVERARLVELLVSRCGWSSDGVLRAIERADKLDREVDDVAGLIDMTGHSLGEDGRHDLVRMAYEIAVADGTIGEFEDDLVWRMGQLLGLTDDGIAAVRAVVVPAAVEGAR